MFHVGSLCAGRRPRGAHEADGRCDGPDADAICMYTYMYMNVHINVLINVISIMHAVIENSNA